MNEQQREPIVSQPPAETDAASDSLMLEHLLTGISGNKTGHTCPICGYDCWLARYMEQPGGTLCLCTCAVCLHNAKTDNSPVPQIVVAEYPSKISWVPDAGTDSPQPGQSAP